MALSWPYIAGLFDGEGWVGCKRSKSVSVSVFWGISQAGKPGKFLLTHVKEFLHSEGVSAVSLNSYYNPKSTHKEIWHLNVSTRRHVIPLLRKLMPLLVVKKAAAQDTLRLLKMFPKRSCRTNTLYSESWAKRRMLYGQSGRKSK